MTRVHDTAFAVSDFNSIVAQSADKGGRFDATSDDPFGFLYAAEDDSTALSEVLLRDLQFDDRGVRLLSNAELKKRRISWLSTNTDLDLVNLRSGKDLAAIGQDPWLTSAPASEFAMTRRWSAAIRKWAPQAQGMTWRSNREPEGFAYIFFADRCPSNCFQEITSNLPVPLGEQDLATGAGRSYVDELLKAYRVALTWD